MPGPVTAVPDVPTYHPPVRDETPTAWWRGALPYLLFVVSTFCFMPRALLGQASYVAVDLLEQTSPTRDAQTSAAKVTSIVQTDQAEFTPAEVTMARAARDGRWPLWEPHVGGGAPLGSLPLFHVASPFNLPFLVLPAGLAVSYTVAFALLVSQVFTALVLRRLGCGHLAAFAGAFAYTFSGPSLIMIHRIMAVFVLPAVVWAVLRLAERRSVARAMVLGAFIAWTWFEGFPSGFVYVVYFAFALATWLLVRHLRHLRRNGRGEREAGRWVLAFAGAGAYGLALAAVNLVPFVHEVTARGLLQKRAYGESAHLPRTLVFGLFDLSTYGNVLHGPWWGGLNPVEAVTVIGSIVLFGVAIGLVQAARGKLMLSPLARDVWGFATVGVIVLTTLTFVGTPLLALAYKLPGIANNPIQRTRVLLPLCFAVLAALGLDRFVRRAAADVRAVPDEPDEAVEAAPRVVSALALAFFLVLAATSFRSFWVLAGHSGERRHVERAVAVAVVMSAAAFGAAFIARRRPRWSAPATVALVALLFVQLAWPLRHFTPEAPRRDFYARTSAHDELARLTAGGYRFAASGNTFYPNSAELLDIYDLRGQVIYAKQWKQLIQAANPTGFDRDPLKLILTRDEWQLASPVYDEVSLRAFALATNEEPFGAVQPVDSNWSGWTPLAASGAHRSVTIPVADLAGVRFALRARGAGCAAARVHVQATVDGEALEPSERIASDFIGDGSWFGFALAGRGTKEGAVATLDVNVTGACAVDIGTTAAGTTDTGAPAVQLLTDDPADGVRIASTTLAWIYERPSARPLVRADGAWRAFSDRAALLADLSSSADVQPVARYLTTAVAPAESHAPATVSAVRFGSDVVDLVVDSAGTQLVTVAQDAADGWHASVDGRDAAVVKVDGALLGVFVPPGRHALRFHYAPASFAVGRAVSAVAIVGGAIALVVPIARRRRRGLAVGELLTLS